MKSKCGADCENCEYGKNMKCKGCVESKGAPFGKECFISRYINLGGNEKYEKLKQELIEEINALKIVGMPEKKELFPLNGAFVNLEYPLENGKTVKYLNDEEIYLGNQVECEFKDEETIRCYGIVANMNFILVSEYGVNGINPEIVIYKKR